MITEKNNASAHFKEWQSKTGIKAKTTDKPFEMYRVFIRQGEKIISAPLGSVFPRFVRHSSTPSRSLHSIEEKSNIY